MSTIRKSLSSLHVAAVVLAVGLGITIYFHDVLAPPVEPCEDVRSITMQAGVLPGEALDDMQHTRDELARRRAAHERSLAQLIASLPTSEAEEQPWISGAILEERTIIEEIASRHNLDVA